MSKSNIEWTQETWNPIVGCSLKSPGCVHCYAMPMAARIEAINAALVAAGKPPQSPQYDGTTKNVNGHPVWTGKLAMAPDSILLRPLKRKKPTTYFVNSMGDLFHEDCPDEWISNVFSVMGGAEHHTFQVLTKRADRMRTYMNSGQAHKAWNARRLETEAFPPRNIWLGVSTERQQEADERIPLLLQTPAAVRFISAEPLLGPLDLNRIHEHGETQGGGAWDSWESSLNGKRFDMWACDDEDPMQPGHAKLDWVIAGGESGLDARPMHPDWARSLRDQCAAANVQFFFKQWGNWREPIGDENYDTSKGRAGSPPAFIVSPDGTVHCFGRLGDDTRPVMIGVGKKRAGRLLDGVEYNGMPGRPA